MAEDYTTINNPKFLFRAELAHPFPDWVVQEEMPGPGSFAKKAATAFADQKRRLLPISTKSAAFHSAINIFARMGDYDADVFDRVKEACAHYGIEDDVAPYALLFADEIEKSAADTTIPEGRFAIDEEIDGDTFRLLPLDDYEDTRSSARELAKMASEKRIHFLMLVPAAREVVKAAAEHGVDSLPATIRRLGERRFADAELAGRLIAGRELLCKDASARELLARDYREALEGVEDDPDAAMAKIAAIDHAAGIESNYKVSAAAPSPFDIVFSGPLVSEAEKTAREHVLVRDVLLPLVAVQGIDGRDADYRLSKQASESLRRLRDSGDARDLSLEIESWCEADQKTLLRLAAA